MSTNDVQTASSIEMDPVCVELRRYLYALPSRFGCKHENLIQIRRELRIMVVSMLVGNYSQMFFGSEPVAKRVFLRPSDWNADEKPKTHSHHGRPCARKLERGEPTHRCLTCGVDDNCVLCTFCYNPDDHIGHNVFVNVSSRDDGGICDCGDSEAWKCDIKCFSDAGPEETKPLPEDFVSHARKVLGAMLDYVVDVLSMSSTYTQLANTPEKVVELAKSSELIPECYHISKEEEEESHRICGTKWCLSVWDDDRRSLNDLYATLQLATSRNEDYLQVIIDHVQIGGRATVAVSSNLGEILSLKRQIRNFSTSIRLLRDIIREEVAMELIKICIDMCHTRLVGIESTALINLIGESLLKPWVAGVPPWTEQNQELSSAGPSVDNVEVCAASNLDGYRIPLSSNPTDVEQLEFSPHDLEFGGDNEDDGQWSSEELFGPRNVMGIYAIKLGNTLRHFMPKLSFSWPLDRDNSKLKYLIFFDIRLPKMLRQDMTDLYLASLVSNIDLKIKLAMIYADIYPLLLDQYCKIDRDPECSISTSLSTQLFTTPSIATRLMETDAFEVYTCMLSGQYIKNGHLNPLAFKNRRLGQIFHEFRNLLWRNNEKGLVGANPGRLIQIGYFLSLFQGLAPLVRQTDKHVEYENERWIFCFAIMPFVIALSRAVAIGVDEGFKQNKPDAAVGMSRIAKALILWQANLYELLVKKPNYQQTPIPPPNTIYHYDTGEPMTLITSKTRVWSDPVSMLNPVHWFLSLLIQYSELDDHQQLLDILEIRNTSDSSLFDANMCTMALLSHISVGYWVRNGLSLKIQLQCYRDTTLRDLAYSQDVHMIQVAFSILNTNAVFTNLGYHFAVLDFEYFALGDDQKTFYNLDEFLQCLTLLLCDRLRFQKLDSSDFTKELLRREIIHMLGFQMMQYSELMKLVPENMASEEYFDTVLGETANYQPPTSENSVGKYSLKPELYELFDPYFTHFTIAQTEEATKACEAKLGPTHLPKLDMLSGTWTRLGLFTKSVAFADFITRLITTIVRDSKAHDTLERILHLLLMAAMDDLQAHRMLYGINAPIDVSDNEKHMRRAQFLSSNTYNHDEGCFRSLGMLALQPQRETGKPDELRSYNLIDLLTRAATLDTFAAARPRIQLLFDLMREIEPNVPLFDSKSFASATNEAEENKAQQKEHAKRMQEKVMADFSRQQEEFMSKHKESYMGSEMEDDDEELDEDEEGLHSNEDTTTGYTFSKQCVFCRMRENEGSVFGILTYTSQVDVLRNLPLDDPYWVKQAFCEDVSLDVPHAASKPLPDLRLTHMNDERNPLADYQPNVSWGVSFPKNNIRETTLVQGCGHGLHYKCYQEVLHRYQQQRLSSLIDSVPSDHEFLCPLCRGLNNCFIPVLWNKNTLDASELLTEPADAFKDMQVATSAVQSPPPISSSASSPVSSSGESPAEEAYSNSGSVGGEPMNTEADEMSDQNPEAPQHISSVVEHSLKFVTPKFLEVIATFDSSRDDHSQFHNILSQQVDWINENSPQGLTSGLRPLFRAIACYIVHIDVSYRGQTYSTPFGGLILDQLSDHMVQFLRVFGMYALTITGFILSHPETSCAGLAEELEDVNLLPNQSFTRAVEMIFLGAKLKGVSHNTVVRQMLVMELDRVLAMARDIDISQLDRSNFSQIKDPEVYETIRSFTDMDPHLIYHFIRSQITLTTRRLALIIFSICGKYDPDDYVGIMHLPEHDRLLEYLQMPDLDTLIKRVATHGTPEWVAHQVHLERNRNQSVNDFRYTFIDYPGMYRLIKLPNRLDSMFNVAGPKLPAEPAVCLLCGALCSIQDNGFQETGPCNMHMATCGVTQGIFLLPRRNVLLLLIPNGRGTFISAPYLDLHGEPDEAMRRGRPHYLQPSRYDLFTRDLWLRNGIPSLVMRRLDQSQDSGGWETL